MENELLKRLKSFAWRVGMIAVAAAIDAALVNLEVLDLPVWSVGLVGLALGELSKYLHNVKVGKAK